MSDEYKSWVSYLAESHEKLEVAKVGDGEDFDVVVCRLAPHGVPLLFPDNLVEPCSKCFRTVQFRPHAPKKPRRVCDECIRPEIEERRKTEDVKFMVTENTARDLALFFRTKGRPQ
jgi:hypothetical protein